VASLSMFNLNNNELRWLVHSNESCHMTSNRNWFQEYKPHSTKSNVYLGNDTCHNIHGNGKITIKLMSHFISKLKKMIHFTTWMKLTFFTMVIQHQ